MSESVTLRPYSALVPATIGNWVHDITRTDAELQALSLMCMDALTRRSPAGQVQNEFQLGSDEADSLEKKRFG